MKTCTKCREEKAVSEYHKRKDARDGLRALCNKCEAAYHKKYGEENKENIAAQKKKYRAENKEKMIASWHKYQARKAGNGGSFTAQEWRDLKKKYGYKCLCCGEKKKLAADHVIPVSKGGTSNIDNIQPLCRSCNSSKGNHHATDYRREND